MGILINQASLLEGNTAAYSVGTVLSAWLKPANGKHIVLALLFYGFLIGASLDAKGLSRCVDDGVKRCLKGLLLCAHISEACGNLPTQCRACDRKRVCKDGRCSMAQNSLTVHRSVGHRHPGRGTCRGG